MTRAIPISKGAVVLVSDEDYERVASAGRWCCRDMRRSSHGDRYRYAQRKFDGRTVMMHRFIMAAPKGLVVDHINHDGLDNRRENLRLCTHAMNLANRRHVYGASSRYLGVNWNLNAKKWEASCGPRYLGLFTDETEAARAYDRGAWERYGAFANLNFSDVPTRESAA